MAKILMIEDDTTLLEMYKKKLENEGFQVAEALDGKDGVEMVRSTMPDLILLDLLIPQMDGGEVLDMIKADPQTKDIPVIILTNIYSIENVKYFFGKGAVDYLLKSDMTPADVAAKIKKTLASQQQKRILLVEDDTTLATMYQEKFEKEGFHVKIAGGGEEALFLAKSYRPHAVLLDIMLPGKMNGFDILEQMKRDTTLQAIPVIVLTNLDSEKNTALSIGAKDYIVKAETSVDEVVGKVKKYL